MKKYYENQEKAKLFHEQRKNEMMMQNMIDNIKSRHENINELREQLLDTDEPTEKIRIEENIGSIEEQIKNMTDKQNEIDKQLKLLKEQLELFN